MFSGQAISRQRTGPSDACQSAVLTVITCPRRVAPSASIIKNQVLVVAGSSGIFEGSITRTAEGLKGKTHDPQTDVYRYG